MRIRSQRDFVSGIVLVGLGAAFAVGATNYDFGSTARPGPGYFPFGLGILLTVLGLVILCTALVQGSEDGAPLGAIPWRPLLCVAGSIAFFGFGLPRFGFLISFPAMIIVTTAAGHEFSWKEALLNAATLTAISFLVFVVGLKLNIPLWPA